MKKLKKLIQPFLYTTLFILSCWNWIYIMIISSDIPVNPSKEEFLIAEGTIIIILTIFIYLTIKGYPFYNYAILLFPNSIWILNFIEDMVHHYHKYDTILSTSMIIVIFSILLWNILLDTLQSKQKKDPE